MNDEAAEQAERELEGHGLSEGSRVPDSPLAESDPDACDRCGTPYRFGWYAPNDLWERIEGTSSGPTLCPACFSEDAEKAGEPLIWKADSPPHLQTFDAILETTRDELTQTKARAEAAEFTLAAIGEWAEGQIDYEYEQDEPNECVIGEAKAILAILDGEK